MILLVLDGCASSQTTSRGWAQVEGSPTRCFTFKSQGTSGASTSSGSSGIVCEPPGPHSTDPLARLVETCQYGAISVWQAQARDAIERGQRVPGWEAAGAMKGCVAAVEPSAVAANAVLQKRNEDLEKERGEVQEERRRLLESLAGSVQDLLRTVRGALTKLADPRARAEATVAVTAAAASDTVSRSEARQRQQSVRSATGKESHSGFSRDERSGAAQPLLERSVACPPDCIRQPAAGAEPAAVEAADASPVRPKESAPAMAPPTEGAGGSK